MLNRASTTGLAVDVLETPLWFQRFRLEPRPGPELMEGFLVAFVVVLFLFGF